ncbi:selection and upkeep of intraepithelial T-cells protein 10-like isoform X5 [Meriones unguiculatus]|uniref:selection and upkeep of intraepithelial T-cells protein 10-like isoform X5 n=1 Tax=Meriones unguiculatus TaxID=10047 RepID=UPI00293F744D|nr:selection and upkeep of intraepithelial T-cells protein 10-like isoform X5 [Meriones unguiculatus]
MQPSVSCLSGFFMAFLLLQTAVHTQAMGLNVEINIQVPDTEGVLVECASGSLIPPAEMIWKDSKGNIISHSSTSDMQDKAGLLYLKSSILLKNRTHGPITCSIYNVTTKQEKKKSIVLPDVLFKPEYMSLMSNKLPWPMIYLMIMLLLNFLRGILVFICPRENSVSHFIEKNIKFKKDWKKKMRLGYELTSSILDDAYPLYGYHQMPPSPSTSKDPPAVPSEQSISLGLLSSKEMVVGSSQSS